MAKKKRHLKKEVKGVLIFVTVLILLSGFIAFYLHSTTFVYEESLEKSIVIIGDTTINLKEISYYVMQVENAGNTYALQYNPDNPVEYWNLYLNQATESGYMSDLARKAAMEYCIRDNIYYQEAVAAGIELTAEEQTELKADAESYFLHMTPRQREVTGLTPENLELILLKVYTAQGYMLYLAEQNGDVSVLESITLNYDVDGAYYENLKNSYTIEINEKIWEQVVPGRVTIN